MKAMDLMRMREGWPEAALPVDVIFDPDSGNFTTTDTTFVLGHAIDLHIASGLRWLLGKAIVMRLLCERHGRSTIVCGGTGADPLVPGRHTSPTLIEAIDAAIREVGK